jgi:inositol transport system permease protein
MGLIGFADRITPIFDAMNAGFTFLRVDTCHQEIAHSLIVVAAVVLGVYQQKKRKKA